MVGYLPDPLLLAIDVFYTVIFMFTAFWCVKVIRLLGVSEISRSWWFISSGLILLFLSALWQTLLHLSGIESHLLTVAFIVPASCLLLSGIYLEGRLWDMKARQMLDQGAIVDEIIEKLIRLRRPDLVEDVEAKRELKRYLRRHLPRLSLAVVMGIVDEWE